ncbi:MAG: hypothetical protein VKK62_09570 [Synechococcaceae cyanobacterium]|nr:hypothetical protein [Synechococcaceae cyanobacterium]
MTRPGGRQRPTPSLDLPRTWLAPTEQRPVFRRRRRRRPFAARLAQAGAGLLLGLAGIGILVALMQLPRRLDTVLLVSNAIANLIAGLSRLSLGLLQLVGVFGVVVLAVLALLLLVGGLMRLFRAVTPGPERKDVPVVRSLDLP